MNKNIIWGIVIAVVVVAGLVYATKGVSVKMANDKQSTDLSSTSTPLVTPVTKVDSTKPVTTIKTTPKTTPITTSSSGIKLLYPNGGETLVVGNEYKIKWFDKAVRANVSIFLASQEVGGEGTNISGQIFDRAGGIDDTSVYSWKIADLKPGKYKITVCNTDRKQCDVSDAFFDIISNPVVAPRVNITAPNGGETFKIGDTVQVKWNTNKTLTGQNKFVISTRGAKAVINASGTTTSYSASMKINTTETTGDVIYTVEPGQYKALVTLHDGIVPKDNNGRTCADRMATGSVSSCSDVDVYGKILAEDQSDSNFTIIRPY